MDASSRHIAGEEEEQQQEHSSLGHVIIKQAPSSSSSSSSSSSTTPSPFLARGASTRSMPSPWPRISTFDRKLKEAALERSAVALLVVKHVDPGGRPVPYKLVPDYRKEDLPNPFLEEMLREASGRLGECVPESYCTSGIATSSRDGAPQRHDATVGTSTSSSSSADIICLAPQLLGTLTDCCYFILYLGDTPPPSTNPFDDDPELYPPASAALSSSPVFGASSNGSISTPPTTAHSYSPSTKPKYMSLRARRRRVYGICRRAPFPHSYSVLLLSATPCFELLRHQFLSLTSTYFQNSCQDNEGDMRAFLLAISNPTTGILHREVASAQSRDAPVIWLINFLGIEHILGLIKLLLLEGRLLFYSSKPYKSSSAVLALLTLIPGLYNQALSHYEEEPLTALHSYRWRKYGMPLRIFHGDTYVLQPLLVLSEANAFFNKYPGFLVGTSNPLISKLPSAQLDAVVDLDTRQIESQRFSSFPPCPSSTSMADEVSPTTTASVAEQQQCGGEGGREGGRACLSPTLLMVDLARMAFEYGPADVDFLEEVLEGLPAREEQQQQQLLLQQRHVQRQHQQQQQEAGWGGSDSWIRALSQNYFEKFLAQAALALHGTIRDGAAAAVASLSSSWVRKAVTGLLQATPRTTCGFDVKLMDYNRAWVGQWTTTLNFRIWHDHYPHSCLPPDSFSGSSSSSSSSGGRKENKSLPMLLASASFSFATGGVGREGEGEGGGGPDGIVECFTYPNGDTYQGGMEGGRRQGVGTYVEHATGNTYEGDWVRDMRHGQGILTTGARDFLYDGGWVRDKREGQGCCTIRGRETYTGGFVENKFWGNGKLVDSEGSVYEGEWRDGRRERVGTLRKADGEVYVGEWWEGGREGVGTCQYVDGSRYTGEWKGGERWGEGTFVAAATTAVTAVAAVAGLDSASPATAATAAAAEQYEGQWLADQRHGWGVQRCGNGDIQEGEWCQDKPKDGEWKITYASGDLFVGECKGGRPHGLGTCKYLNGDVYTGGWEDGLRVGEGVCVFARASGKEKFEGRWAGDRPVVDDFCRIPPTYDEEEEGGEKGREEGREGPPRRPRRRLLMAVSAGVGGPSSPRKGVEVPVTPLGEIARMSGEGCVVVYPTSGDTYVGSMKEGRREGVGVYVEKKSGNKYEGSFKEDRREGYGVLTSGARDFLYDGEWVGDRRTGRGACVVKGKESYTGEWVEDVYHGKGKSVDAAGNTYEGEYVQGRREGAGTLMRTDGEVYVGEWREGGREGVGQCQYADGACYSGEWGRDRWNGEGVLVSAEVEKHEGLWSEGRRQGWGVWTSPTGDVIEGEWLMDEPKDGEWKITYSNGDMFVGKCRDGRPEGFGICKYANGAVYSGEWREGGREGQGQCVFANGEIYDGVWEKDHVSLRGLGTLSFQDGRVHEFS